MIPLKLVDRKLFLLGLAALLLECWMLFSNYHFLWHPPRIPLTATRVAKVQGMTNLAHARSPLQLNWFTLSAGQDLYEGDEVATVGNSTVTLQFLDGHTLTLGSNSLVVLRISPLLESQAFKLTLVRGSLQQDLALAPDTKAGTLEIEVGGRKVITTGGASFKIESHGGGAPRIDVGTGQVQVTDTGGRGLSLPPILAPMDAVLLPVLRAPGHGAVIDLTRQKIAVVPLKWEASSEPGSIFLVEVATDSEFQEVVWSHEDHGGFSTEFPPAHKGQYFWRVSRLRDGRKWVSAVGGFAVRWQIATPTLYRPKVETAPLPKRPSVDAPVLKRPIIHYPWEGKSSFLFRLKRFLDPEPAAWADESPAGQYNVDLSWEDVSGAKAYVLQIASDSEFLHIAHQVMVPTAHYRWRTDTAGFYYWRVAAIDVAGERGGFSEFQTFTISAERNLRGDVMTYETFQRFDDYSKQQNQIRLFYGPDFANYFFSGNDPHSPPSVVFRKMNWDEFRAEYRAWLSPYYSFEGSVFTEKRTLIGGDYETPQGMHTRFQHETAVSFGVERRFFLPRFYYTLHVGVRASFIDLPAAEPMGNQLEYDNFSFVGAYLTGGIHKTFFSRWDGALFLGGVAQYSGDAYRLAQTAGLRAQRRMSESISLGFDFSEVLAAYEISADHLSGSAHSLDLRPMFLLEVSF